MSTSGKTHELHNHIWGHYMQMCIRHILYAKIMLCIKLTVCFVLWVYVNLTVKFYFFCYKTPYYNICILNSGKLAKHLSKELIKDRPLAQCWEVANLLSKFLKHREKTIKILTDVVRALDKQSKLSSGIQIASSACGILAAIAMAITPLGKMGGAVLASTGVNVLTSSIGDSSTEKKADKVVKAIQADALYVKKLIVSWNELKKLCDFEDFNYCYKSQALYALVMMYKNKEKEQLSSDHSEEKTADMIMTFMKNIGAEIAGITYRLTIANVIILFKKAYDLVTNEGHSESAEIRSIIDQMESERNDLETLNSILQHHLSCEEESSDDAGFMEELLPNQNDEITELYDDCEYYLFDSQ